MICLFSTEPPRQEPPGPSWNRNYAHFFLVVLAAIGFAGLLFLTNPWGIGLSRDSAHYIAAARNLLNGYGVSDFSFSGEIAPMTHWPPLLSILLAMIATLGIEPPSGARWLNAFLFAGNILLVGLAIRRCIRVSAAFSVFGAFLILTSVDMLAIHSMAWSEPLFIFCTLAGFLLLAAHIENQQRWLLLASACVMGLAFLSRYIGIVVVATGVFSIIILSKAEYYSRIINALLFGVVSSIPVALWFIRNRLVSGRSVDTDIEFHSLKIKQVKAALFTFSNWLLPATSPTKGTLLLPVLAAGLLISSLLVLLRNSRVDRDSLKERYPVTLPLIFIIFTLFYGAFLVFSISFFYETTPLDSRILSPIFISAVILVLYAIHMICTLLPFIGRVKSLKIVPIMVCLVLGGLFLFRATGFFSNVYQSGQGYSSKAWRQNEIIQKVRELASHGQIYSNNVEAIYLLTGKPSSLMPIKSNKIKRTDNNNYPSEMAAMSDGVRNHGAILTYFNTFNQASAFPPEKELQEEWGLPLIESGSDGSLYGLKNAR